VSGEGELLGIIDWDGVAAVPRSLGNERYPGWLTRDWDPAMYGYAVSMEQSVEPEGVWEDSPEDLAFYRGVYDDIMARHRADQMPESTVNLSRMSLITENLEIATRDPPCRNEILRKVVREISQVVGLAEEMDFFGLPRSFAEDAVDNTELEKLRKGFEALLSMKGL